MSTQYDELLKKASAKNFPNQDWRLLKSQLRQESQFNPNATSRSGAVGLMQFMPETWNEWSAKAGFPQSLRNEPEASIMAGALYMMDLWAEWDSPRPEIDRYCLALASYNAGLANIIKAQKLAGGVNDYKAIIQKLKEVTGPKNAHETMTYVRRILNYYTEEVVG